MKARIKRFDKSLPLPRYSTAGSAGLDCYVRETTTIAPNQTAFIPLNIAVQPPKNHFVLLAARSSLPKRGLFLANGVGIADEDYCGDQDEYKALVYNYTGHPVTVEKGDRVVQMIFKPYERVEWEEVEKLQEKNRGGFGSTGA